MKRTKIVILWILSLMLVLLVVQNTAYVRARFLWLTADVPVILLLSFTAAGGFVSGILVALLLRNKTRTKGEPHGKQEVVSAEKAGTIG